MAEHEPALGGTFLLALLGGDRRGVAYSCPGPSRDDASRVWGDVRPMPPATRGVAAAAAAEIVRRGARQPVSSAASGAIQCFPKARWFAYPDMFGHVG